MKRMIFVNLPVADLDKAKAFYTALGFAINPQFSDETAASIVISEEIHVMLLTHQKFLNFVPTGRGICDSGTQLEVLTALSCSDRGEVDSLVDKALAAGGTSFSEPQDHGFMYQRSFQDPDGHVWELVWMDMSAFAA